MILSFENLQFWQHWLVFIQIRSLSKTHFHGYVNFTCGNIDFLQSSAKKDLALGNRKQNINFQTDPAFTKVLLLFL